MNPVAPDALLPGRALLMAPHMDDELLGCGVTIARLSDPTRVFVGYATDGAASPIPPAGSDEPICGDLPRLRRSEAVEAMAVLGVPAENLRFLDLPDGELMQRRDALENALRALIAELRPDHVLLPFRYDRHPDHLALNHAIRRVVEEEAYSGDLFEYFVYARTRLLFRGDLRAYLHPDHLALVEPAEAGAVKRRALECNRTQVTLYFPWQLRPILTGVLLDENCESPEVFLRTRAAERDEELFDAPLWLIRAAHSLEPRLKRWKDRTVETLGRARSARRPQAR